jgi:hypothetical protein|tara:strand:- start:282 stop:677 length:396 start_codon:yes stop_codon:yes gene_type:complete
VWIGQREIGVMAAVVPEICVRLGIIDAVGGIPRYLSAALTSLLEAEVHGDGDEIAAVPLDGFDLDARGRGPGERQERDQRRQNPRARHGGDRARALLTRGGKPASSIGSPREINPRRPFEDTAVFQATRRL